MLIWTDTHGPTLVDENKMPRYWAAVWTLLNHAELSPRTVSRKLGYVESFYQHVEELGGEVDDLLAGLDIESSKSVLESFFFKLRNVANRTTAPYERWKETFKFVRDTLVRLHRNPASSAGMQEAIARVQELDNLFLGLWPYRKKALQMPRAIPRQVILELLNIVEPGSARNPFHREDTQWRVFLCVSKLLYHGLRKGELLLLKASSLSCERHPKTNEFKWRLNVRMNVDDPDSRALKPEIKNSGAIRTIPVTEKIANTILAYQDNYRGTPAHPFLINSALDRPMSLSGIDKMFKRINEQLSPRSKEVLLQATNATGIQPHALRHTCATIKVKQFSDRGDTPEEVMMNMRSYFGWSRESTMPLLYAKVAIDERLNEHWDASLDERLEALRLLK